MCYNLSMECTITDCMNVRYCKGYCSPHYWRNKKYGDFDLTSQHKQSATPLYSTWEGMMSRCYNENSASYELYGGRGIKVCERWHKFMNFKEDMGDKPSKNYSLDRIDGSTDYSLNNCRWGTWRQQALNKRLRSKVTSKYKGVSFYKSLGKYVAKACGKHLGVFVNEIDAAIAYDTEATRLYGDDAYLNFPIREAKASKKISQTS